MTTQQMLAALRAWLAENYPGCKLRHVNIIHCRRLPRPIRLVAGPEPSAPAGTSHAEELPLCVQEILQTLREVKRPLSLTLLKEEMGRRGRSYSRSTLAHYCAELAQDGTLENPKGVRPAGYRLTPDAPPELPAQQ